MEIISEGELSFGAMVLLKSQKHELLSAGKEQGENKREKGGKKRRQHVGPTWAKGAEEVDSKVMVEEGAQEAVGEATAQPDHARSGQPGQLGNLEYIMEPVSLGQARAPGRLEGFEGPGASRQKCLAPVAASFFARRCRGPP